MFKNVPQKISIHRISINNKSTVVLHPIYSSYMFFQTIFAIKLNRKIHIGRLYEITIYYRIDLFMKKLGIKRVNQQIPTRSPKSKNPSFIKNQPLNSRYVLSLNWGEIGSDLDPRSGMIELKNKHN